MPVADVNPQRRELINRRHDAGPTDSWHRPRAHRGRGRDYYHGPQPDHSIERSTGAYNYHRSIDHEAEGHWSQARSHRSSRQDLAYNYRSQNPANGHWRQQQANGRDGSGNSRPSHMSLRQRLQARESSPQKPAWQQLSLSERPGYASAVEPEKASPTTTAATTCDASSRPVASPSKPDEIERRVRDLPLGHDLHEPWSIRQISSYEALLDMAVEESGHDHKSKTMRAIAQSFSERGLGSDLSARALDIVYDLCEDTDPEIRRIGYTTLVSISQTSSTELVRRNADVLLQILGNEMTAEEHRAVSLALVAHLELGCIGLLKFLLQQTPAPSGAMQDPDPFAVLLRFLASYGSEVVTLVDSQSKRIRGDAELEAELLETLTSVMPLCNLDGLLHLLGLVSHIETIWLPHRDFLAEQTFQRTFRALRSFFNGLSSELAYAVSPSLAEQVGQATEEPSSPTATGHDLLDSTQIYLANLYDSVSLFFADCPQEDFLVSKMQVFIRSFLLGPKTRGPDQERPLLVSRSPLEVLSAEARIIVARAAAELAVEISPETGLDDLFVGLTAAISSLVPLFKRSARDETVGVLVTLSDAAVCEALLFGLSTLLSRFKVTSEEPGLSVDMGLLNSTVFRQRLQNLSGTLPHGTSLAMKTSPSRSAAMPYNVQLLARHLSLLAEQKEPADGQTQAISALVPSWKVTDGPQFDRDHKSFNHISKAIDGLQEEGGELSSRAALSNGNGPSAVKRQRLDDDDDETMRPHSRDDHRTTLRTLDGPVSVSGMTQLASPAQQPPSGPRKFTIRGRSSLVASPGLSAPARDPQYRSPVSQRWMGEQGSLSAARESTGSLSVEPRDVEQHGERVHEGPRAPADFRMHPDRVQGQWQSVNGGHHGSAGYHSHGYRDNRRGGGGYHAHPYRGYHRRARGRY